MERGAECSRAPHVLCYRWQPGSREGTSRKASFKKGRRVCSFVVRHGHGDRGGGRVVDIVVVVGGAVLLARGREQLLELGLVEVDLGERLVEAAAAREDVRLVTRLPYRTHRWRSVG